MTSREQAVSLALARSCLYYILSPLFLYPEEKTFSDLNWEEGEEAVALLGNSEEIKEAFESLRRSLKPVDEMRSKFSRIFGYTIQSDCPPYETQYGSGEYTGANSQLAGAQIFEQGQTLGDIAGFYRTFGLEVSEQINERLDHISIELEFMAFLAYKEAYALASSNDDKEDKAQICREAQVKFLKDHLGKWVPVFTKRLEEAAKDGFYRKLAQMSDRFVTLELKALGVYPIQVEGLIQIASEPEGLCERCGIERMFASS